MSLDAIAVIDAFVEVAAGLEGKRALACVNHACADQLRVHFAQRVLTVDTGDCTRRNGMFVRRLYLKRRDLVLRTRETQEDTNERLEECVDLDEYSYDACNESFATSSFFVGYTKYQSTAHRRGLSFYEGNLATRDWSRLAGAYNFVAEVEWKCAKTAWLEHVARRGYDEAWFVVDLSHMALHVSTGDWLVQRLSNPNIKLLSLEVRGAVPLSVTTELVEVGKWGIDGVLMALTAVGVCIPSLRRLDLSYSNLTKCAIHRLSAAFARGAFPSLDTLILSNTGAWDAPNTMTSFAKSLQHLEHLHTLDLSKNFMSDTVLRRFMHNFNFHRLRSIDLGQNCTLTDAVMIDFVNNIKNIVEPFNLHRVVVPRSHTDRSGQRTGCIRRVLNSYGATHGSDVTSLFEHRDRSHTYDRSLYTKHRMSKSDKVMLG